MSQTDSETPEPGTDDTAGIGDEQLPEDLQPGEDNPLMEPLDEEVDTEELDVLEGKTADESDTDTDEDADAAAGGASDPQG